MHPSRLEYMIEHGSVLVQEGVRYSRSAIYSANRRP